MWQPEDIGVLIYRYRTAPLNVLERLSRPEQRMPRRSRTARYRAVAANGSLRGKAECRQVIKSGLR